MKPPRFGAVSKASDRPTIGWLAKAAGVGIGAIRLYQRRGLLAEPARPAYGGFRTYGPKDIERILQIRGAQELGFTLNEIQQLFAHLDKSDCRSARTVLDGKLSELKDREQKLQVALKRLTQLRKQCGGECGDCSLLLTIGREQAAG